MSRTLNANTGRKKDNIKNKSCHIFSARIGIYP